MRHEDTTAQHRQFKDSSAVGVRAKPEEKNASVCLAMPAIQNPPAIPRKGRPTRPDGLTFFPCKTRGRNITLCEGLHFVPRGALTLRGIYKAPLRSIKLAVALIFDRLLKPRGSSSTDLQYLKTPGYAVNNGHAALKRNFRTFFTFITALKQLKSNKQRTTAYNNTVQCQVRRLRVARAGW